MWESLEIRLLREQETAGSNPAAPTVSLCFSGGACAGTGDRLLTGLPQVRFLPPELSGKGKPMGDGSRFENDRAMSLEGSTPSPSAVWCPKPCVALVEQSGVLVSLSRRRPWVQIPPGALDFCLGSRMIAGWRNRQTRESQKLVPTPAGVGVRPSPRRLSHHFAALQASRCSAGPHEPGRPDRYRGLGFALVAAASLVPSSRGEGPCLTNRRSQVRVLPG